MEICPMGTSRYLSFSSRTTMSEPPVEVPQMNTTPNPRPQITPPYRALISGSMGGMGTAEKTSISTELISIPSRLPQKNRRPIFMPPRMNRGRLMSMLSVPTLPIPTTPTITSARPEMPPGLISLGCKNREKPRANTALPRTVAGIQPYWLQNLRIHDLFFLTHSLQRGNYTDIQ